MRAGTVAILLVGSVLIFASAKAEPVSGTLTFEGIMTLPPQSEATFRPIAAFTDDAAHLADLRIDVGIARVSYFEKRYQTMTIPGLPRIEVESGFVERSWTATNLHLTIQSGATNDGFIGFYPGEDATVAANETNDLQVEPKPFSAMGNFVGSAADQPELPIYRQEVATPHLRATTSGNIVFEGRNGAKLVGPDVELRSDENTTTFETGEAQTSATEIVFTWLYIKFDAGTVHLMLTGKPLEIAATQAETFSADGVIRFASLSGTIGGREATYTAAGASAELEGRFAGSLAPRDHGDIAMLELSGDLRAASVSVVRQPVPTGPPLLPASWSLVATVLFGVVVIGTGTLGAVIWHRRKNAHPEARDARTARTSLLVRARAGTPLEDALADVRIAAEHEDWQAALDAVRDARRFQPKDAGLAATEASYLRRLGRYDEAISAYQEAAVLGDETANVGAAICATQQDDLDLAFAFVRVALEADPENYKEVEHEIGLERLRERTDFQEAMRNARDHTAQSETSRS